MMADKTFLLQRIAIYIGDEIDPNSDIEVKAKLKDRFNIDLPQRQTMNEALKAAISDHEIIDLILRYRLTR